MIVLTTSLTHVCYYNICVKSPGIKYSIKGIKQDKNGEALNIYSRVEMFIQLSH